MNMGKDFTFPLSRRLLEAIDILLQLIDTSATEINR